MDAGSVFDVAIVGGGLQGALMALWLLRKPGIRVALIEQGQSVGGNHTWCFHQSDVHPRQLSILAPLVDRVWNGYDVRFRHFDRTLATRYSAITSTTLHEHVSKVMRGAVGAAMFLGQRSEQIEPGRITLESGQVLRAGLVIDARGPDEYSAQDCAYQKFVGLEVELAEEHDCRRVRLMDACVEQLDGFRFVYVLPWGARRLLIEDTYFSVEPTLDRELVTARVLDYAKKEGWKISSIVRSEHGVLPLPLRPLALKQTERVLNAGYGGGWFHPVTGYSLPSALRLAEAVSENLDAPNIHDALGKLLARHRSEFRFGTWLNQLLYRAFPPEEQWNVFERFYRLPETTISRFYAGSTTTRDRARIVCGRPPRGMSVRHLLTAGGSA